MFRKEGPFGNKEHIDEMKIDWLPSNWYMNQHKKRFMFYKNPIVWNVFLSDLADLLGYELCSW